MIFDFQNAVEFIKAKNGRVNEILKSLADITEETNQKWNENVTKMHAQLQQLITKRGFQLTTEPFVDDIIKFYNKWRMTNEEGMISLEKNFVEKVTPILSHQLNNNLHDQDAFDFLSILQRMSFIYKSKKTSYDRFANNLDEAANSIDKNFTKLKNTKSELQKLKFKSIFNLT